MSEFTILNNSDEQQKTKTPAPISAHRLRGPGFHLLRVLLLIAIVLVIYWQHQRRIASRQDSQISNVEIADVQSLIPRAHRVVPHDMVEDALIVLDDSNQTLGYVLTTSPHSDHIIGFSGPTNLLVAVSNDKRIVAIRILSSSDTREHVEQVESDQRFAKAFFGLDSANNRAIADIAAVSGATLTSRAIQEAVIHRLTGQQLSLRFPDVLDMDDTHQLFPGAANIQRDHVLNNLWAVHDQAGEQMGWIMSTSPAADHIAGYQGPSRALVGMNTQNRVTGLLINDSFDNEPYVGYVRDDEYFHSQFKSQTIRHLASSSMESLEIEGVSGATMTSQAVAESILHSAVQFEQRRSTNSTNTSTADQDFRSGVWPESKAVGTGAVIVAALVIGFSRLRGNRVLRIAFQAVLILYLGLINGDLISQAMFFGWAQNGVPLFHATGLILLSGAALLVPLTTKRNIYCSHLCPHGAAQALLKNRSRFRLRIPRKLGRVLKAIPAVLLAWCLIVTLFALPYSLIDIEPFDAWVFYIAGWSTISIAFIGLIASTMLPMAYCRYGCPTGALLNFLRFNQRSDQWQVRDWVVVILFSLAIASLLWT